MKLFYRKHGAGQPILILHGLFGQCDNWQTIGKKIADAGFEVYLIDQRNHGLSPHSNEWNYEVMAEDIKELIENNKLEHVILIGHSMGGKAAMQFAENYPHFLHKLIVVDIAPRYYSVHHQTILKALTSVDFTIVKNRKEADEIMAEYIPESDTRQFLLKNIYWREDGLLAWRFNLPVIADNIEEVGKENLTNTICTVDALFMRGELSDYITESDEHEIALKFPNSQIITIKQSRHWIQAEQPQQFYDKAIKFINN